MHVVYLFLLFSAEAQPLTNMPSEKFAEYLGNEMAQASETLRSPVAKIIRIESINSSFFATLNPEDLESVFKDREGITYGLGVKNQLRRVQDQIRRQQAHDSDTTDNFAFRPFLKSAFGIHYKVCICSVDHAPGLLDAVHYFSFPDKQSPYYFAKEVIRFATGCINARQNGTIHFGIKPLENHLGRVLGVSRTVFSNAGSLMNSINIAIRECFQSKEQQGEVLNCLGPVLVIPLDEHNVVLEMDVIPHYSCLSDTVYVASFPPKGPQSESCFMFVKTIYKVDTIDSSRVHCIKREHSSAVSRRKHLDNQVTDHYETKPKLLDLKDALTDGNEYVTDNLYPVLMVGSRSSTTDTGGFLESLLKMKSAFLSSSFVFDFDRSTRLMEAIEESSSYFHVVTAEDFLCENIYNYLFQAGNIWLFCNGNQDHGTPSMDLKDYRKHRMTGVNESLQIAMKTFGARAMFILFVFKKLIPTDPEYVHAEDIIKHNHRPIIISDRAENLEDLKKSCSKYVDRNELGTIFHYGFSWNEVCNELSTVFRRDPDTVCKLPDNQGGFVTMTKKDKFDRGIKDIELLSGNECKLEFNSMSDTEQKEKEEKERENFYRGVEVTWWNFFFQLHVCERTILTDYTEEIQTRMATGKNRLEVIEILHQPGSGGTTLGKHILWHFSQFKTSSRNSYRCCVVKSINKGDTASQIASLRAFKAENLSEAKPVIVLLDNKTEESLKNFISDLDEKAYRNGSSTKVFCVLIILSRCSIKMAERKKNVLRHELQPQEISWFTSKYNEQLKTFGEAHVKSLISFNVMKANFDKTYIEETTTEIMKGVTKSEKILLQHLSLLNYFDILESPVPGSVFDDLMGVKGSSYRSFQIKDLTYSGPVGLVIPGAQRHQQYSRTWNCSASEACRLLLKDKYLDNNPSTEVSKLNSKGVTNSISVRSQTFNYQKGLMIVSPLVALAILKRIQMLTGKPATVLITELLDFAKKQKPNLGDRAAEYFTQLVCSLFKTRERHAEFKSKFSKLVESIYEGQCEFEINSGNNVENTLQIMKKCCQELDDPFVGQSLARFYYLKLNRFDDAEIEIRLSISKVESNPYLYDTLGQIFKEKLKYDMVNLNFQSDENVVRLFTSAQEAMKAFEKAQNLSEKQQIDETITSLRDGLDTMLYLLENSEKYLLKGSKERFYEFLNGKEDAVFDCYQPHIGSFRKGNSHQRCIEDSLRHLEYSRCMIKRKYNESKSFEDDKSKSKLRTRFSKIYSKTDASERFGETMQALKDAHGRSKSNGTNILEKLARSSRGELKIKQTEKSLLVYIGAKTLLSCEGSAETTSEEYNNILQYTKALVELQQSRDRPYIEAFMYLALYHWPLESRMRQHLAEMCSFDKLEKTCQDWKRAYDDRFKRNPTLYYVLGNGKPGMDIVDQKLVKEKWNWLKTKERYDVKSVDIFNVPDFVDQYTRFEGIVDLDGRFVKHEVGTFTLFINIEIRKLIVVLNLLSHLLHSQSKLLWPSRASDAVLCLSTIVKKHFCIMQT